MFRPMYIVAHRGYSARYPENTLQAFTSAFHAGAHVVETDVRLSAEGEAVCIHDATLLRLAQQDIPVASLTVAELQHFLPQVCTLKDVFSYIARSFAGRILLDVKIPEALPLVASLVQSFPLEGQVTVGVRTVAQAQYYRSLDAHSPILGFLNDYTEFASLFTCPGTYPRFWEQALLDNQNLLEYGEGRPFWVTAGAPATGSCGDTNQEQLRRLMQLNPYALLVNDPVIIHP